MFLVIDENMRLCLFMNVSLYYSILQCLKFIFTNTYFFLIPGVVSWALHDLEDDWCHEDDKDQNWSNKSPGDLPVNPNLNSCHFTNVLKLTSNNLTIRLLSRWSIKLKQPWWPSGLSRHVSNSSRDRSLGPRFESPLLLILIAQK